MCHMCARVLLRRSVRYCSRSVSQPVRVRFAPSPTGQLHLGGLLTALINYLFARRHGGRFLLRIEDTDQQRYVDGAEADIQRTLDDYGLYRDEGPNEGGDYGPYRQSERKQLYQQAVQTLIDKDAAYPCFCTADRLMIIRREALQRRETPQYDNRCRNVSREEAQSRIEAGESHVVRFRLSDDDRKFFDGVYGETSSAPTSDPVILKSAQVHHRMPTYHLANVVDDHHMRISHVIRGQEWLPSTSIHHQLYSAFGWEKPAFYHLPSLMDMQGRKLSKRGNGMTDRDDSQLLTLAEMIEKFDELLLTTSKTKCDVSHLRHFGVQAMRSCSMQESVTKVRQLVESSDDFAENQSLYTDFNVLSDEYISNAVRYANESGRVSCFSDYVNDPTLQFMWTVPKDTAQLLQMFPTESALCILQFEIDALQGLVSLADFADRTRAYCAKEGLKYRQVMAFLRLALTGCKTGPPVLEMIELLGFDQCARRLQLVLDRVQS